MHALVHYPIKGCAGLPVTDAEMAGTGLAHDRTFMVGDPVQVRAWRDL